jgi:predicted kinase
VSRRLRCALEEVVPTWKEPTRTVKAVVVNTCARLVRAGVQVMLDSGRHPRVERAIVMVAATAEVLQVQQSDAAALEFLNEFVAKHRQHEDFTGADGTRTSPHSVTPSWCVILLEDWN